jgi:hypothetical protein
VAVAQLWIVRRHSRFMKHYTSPIIAALLVLLFAGCSKHPVGTTAVSPKVPDLGVVEVSDGIPSRHDLGGGRVCTIIPAIQKDGSIMLTLKIEQDGKLLAMPRVQTLSGRAIIARAGDIGVELTPEIKR